MPLLQTVATNRRPGDTSEAMLSPAPVLSLKPVRSELTYTAALRSPAYGALPSEGKVYGAIYAAFEKHGAKVEDIRPEAPALSPADVSVVCSLTRQGALVRFRV